MFLNMGCEIMLVLILSIICIILMIVSILVFPKLKVGKIRIDTYFLITSFFAILFILLKLISFRDIKEALINDSSINPVKIIILFFSMTFMSVFLDKAGFFKYLASKATLIFKKNQRLLFTSLFILISVLTIFTSNDIMILSFTPFICYFCKNTRINPIPYLIGLFFSANTLSMSLIIGNPTNIYIASIMDISFIDYFKFMFWRSLLCAILLYIILIVIFNKDLNKEIIVEERKPVLKSKALVAIAIAHLGVCTLLMAISNYLNFEMYIMASIFAISLFIISIIYSFFNKDDRSIITSSLKKLPYSFIPFLISMVIIISALNKSGATDKIRVFFSEYNSVFSYGLSSFLAGNLLNNIPMSILYSSILQMNELYITKNIVYSVIASSNLCALFTPLGSLAGMMFLNLVNNQGIKFNFISFMKYSFISIIMLAFMMVLLYI